MKTGRSNKIACVAIIVEEDDVLLITNSINQPSVCFLLSMKNCCMNFVNRTIVTES